MREAPGGAGRGGGAAVAGRGSEGHTLTELVVVVLILGVVVAVAVPSFLGLRERGYRGAVHADLRNAAIAVEVYHSLAGRYPVDGELTLPPTEPSVTVRIARPVDPEVADMYCLEATHERLGADVVAAVFDPLAGGVDEAGTCS